MDDRDMKHTLCSQIIHYKKTEAILWVSDFVVHDFIVAREIAMFSIRENTLIYLACYVRLAPPEDVNMGY